MPLSWEDRDLKVGSKKFTESVILGEMLAQLASDSGAMETHYRELGGTKLVYQALLDGDIDIYPDYTGTITEEILAGQDASTDEQVRAALGKDGILISKPLGFNNTYAIGMTKQRARELGVNQLSDLARLPDLKFGFSNEFMDREDGWQRRLSLWLTRRFVEARRLDLPGDIAVSDMDAVHRNLVEHLIDFEQGIHTGEVPGIIETASASEDKKLAALAQGWIERHDAWRTAANVPSPEDEDPEEPPPFQHTPFTRKLMQALSSSLDNMVTDGELELDPDRKDALLIELVTAGSDARSVKHMLKKLTSTLVDSEHVEEIYPSDDKIQDRLKQDLGG